MAKTLDELNSLYMQAEEVDREVFAEMRSNILLVAGDHYNLRARNDPRIRGKVREQEQKLRLTKNHMHRISREYVSAIMDEGPSVAIRPQVDTDLQDQKDAELNLAVWRDIERRHKLEARLRDFCKDYVDVGEVCAKIFWDNSCGDLVGYEPKVDEFGQPVMEETGEYQEIPGTDPETGLPTIFREPIRQPVLDESRPIFTGDFVFERIYAFNLLRSPAAQEMDDKGKPWIVRKLVDTAELREKYRDDKEKLEGISASSEDTFVVFDANKGRYNKPGNQTLIREFFWPPCYLYPRGYYQITTRAVILEEDELPEGIWPFVWTAFDKYQTTPRGRSILKIARSYQAELNRASSKVAEAQVTLGDDKILYMEGANLTQGAVMPGVRGISYRGSTPIILGGRDGSQYMPYIQSQIQELDKVTLVDRMAIEDSSGQVDPYALLFRSFAKKKVYKGYAEKFGNFYSDFVELTLKLAKVYLPDDAVIPAVGARERINIAEFRKTSKLSHQIVIEPSNDTLESMFGRQLTFQHLLQYVGKDLDPKILGKLLKNLPFGNSQDTFDDLTIDEDVARNDMLALERGEQVGATKYVEPSYMLKRLTSRMKTPEYKFLSPQVQQAYTALLQQYEALEAEIQQKLIAAKNEYIPTDGALVACDVYVNDPANPDKKTAHRARLPQRALEWLIQRLEEQGAGQAQLEGMNDQALAELYQVIEAKQRAGAQPQQMQQPSQGGAMPGAPGITQLG